jgi:hypothetical protein
MTLTPDSSASTATSDVIVSVDDRVRLFSALLAATAFPEREQARKPHGTHMHARATRKAVSALGTHAAVQALGSVIDQGASLDRLFNGALAIGTPEAAHYLPATVIANLRDFYAQASLVGLWKADAELWKKAEEECKRVFAAFAIKPFFEPIFGAISEKLVFMPNISYPTSEELAISQADALIVIAPPRIAWGENPPWSFDEDAAYLYRAAIAGYCRVLLATLLKQSPDKLEEAKKTPIAVSKPFAALFPTWEAQFAQVFSAAAVAIYLEDHVSTRESSAYLLMERKVRGLDTLPAAVSVTRRYLNDAKSGQKALGDFLPTFAKQLKVATRIKAL